jgi:hypothetical protein
MPTGQKLQSSGIRVFTLEDLVADFMRVFRNNGGPEDFPLLDNLSWHLLFHLSNKSFHHLFPSTIHLRIDDSGGHPKIVGLEEVSLSLWRKGWIDLRTRRMRPDDVAAQSNDLRTCFPLLLKSMSEIAICLKSFPPPGIS